VTGIDRAGFLGGLIATGGLDIWDDVPQAGTTIRVALAGGGITTLDLETYLCGVVPLEAPPAWPAAALQAQAIVARTYALAKRNLTRPYDVRAGDADQQYGGNAAARPATNDAVAATRGMVLLFAGGPVSVFYSSCCGGHTADAATLWGRSGLSYLRGVDDVPNCTASPDYRWRRSLPLVVASAALADRMRAPLAGFALSDLDATGRARTALVSDANGAVVAFPIEELRRRWGAEAVRSLWVRSVAIDRTQAVPSIVIEGNGRGHGVGLCQWGAHGLASAGADAATILAHFFPGTEVSGG
jgi:stage II sporulation protein D